MAYLAEHRDEITAIQLLAEASDVRLGRRVSFDDIKELADRIARPPRNWTVDLVWNAYLVVEGDRKHLRAGRGASRTLTDLVSLIRYTLGADDSLVPYSERVAARYANWLAQQAQAGGTFTPRQRWWLDRMVKIVATSAGISAADLDQPPFTEHGGVEGALRDLGPEAAELIEELNQELTG
jgi:type I restriction enzyme R subunit